MKTLFMLFILHVQAFALPTAQAAREQVQQKHCSSVRTRYISLIQRTHWAILAAIHGGRTTAVVYTLDVPQKDQKKIIKGLKHLGYRVQPFGGFLYPGGLSISWN